jgi:hypothetical protein
MNRARIMNLLLSAIHKSRLACERTKRMVERALVAFCAACALLDRIAQPCA